jgi:RING-variant domain
LDNPSIILIEPDEEPAALASQFAGQSDADKALLRNNLLRPFEPLEGGSESEEVSQWDVSTKGLRDDAIQFYVGSTYTLRSATSTVSFFNTLYAKGYAPICRICHQTASEKEALESACNCKGSLRYVHHSCLLKWLDMRSRHLGKICHSNGLL